MPLYRIHRLKDNPRQHFRWAPHASGVTGVKPRDYSEDGTVEAAGVYAAWTLLRDSERALGVGDLLETESGELVVCKYVGFEEARWILPEPLPATAAGPPSDVAAGG